MTTRTQQARSANNNTPPGALPPGQLFLEMATPLRLWAGVPTSIDPTGRRMLLDASAASAGPFLALSGGALTGPLVLAADPAVPLGAATKQYVDARGFPDAPANSMSFGRNNAAWARVPAFALVGAGGTFNPATGTPSGYVGLYSIANQTGAAGWPTGEVDQTGFMLVGYNSNAGWPNKLLMSGRSLADGSFPLWVSSNDGVWCQVITAKGAAMSGPLVLAADPSAALQAATKQYVDGLVGRAGGPFLALAGGTLTGALILNADPTTPLGAVTRRYADGFLPLVGGTVTGTLNLNGALNANGVVNANGGVNAGSLAASKTGGASVLLVDPAAGADQKAYDFVSMGNVLRGRALNDAYSQANDWLTVTRSGTTISQVALDGTAINLNGTVTTSGDVNIDGTTYISRSAMGTHFRLFGAGRVRVIQFTDDGWNLQYDGAIGNLTYFNSGGGAVFWSEGATSDFHIAGNVHALNVTALAASVRALETRLASLETHA